MSIPIHITIHLSIPTALEILNVAINGGCESWAHITEKQSGPEDRHVYTSAKFTSRANSAVCMTVSEREVATGIQRVLDNGFPIAPAVKKNILRAVANNDAGEVDTEAADSVVRAVLMSGTALVTPGTTCCCLAA